MDMKSVLRYWITVDKIEYKIHDFEFRNNIKIYDKNLKDQSRFNAKINSLTFRVWKLNSFTCRYSSEEHHRSVRCRACSHHLCGVSDLFCSPVSTAAEQAASGGTTAGGWSMSTRCQARSVWCKQQTTRSRSIIVTTQPPGLSLSLSSQCCVVSVSRRGPQAQSPSVSQSCL